MPVEIIDSVEQERGCGYRKGGGLYLMAGRPSRACGKLPVEVGLCPCCGTGLQPHRGFNWVTSALLDQTPCSWTEAKCSGGCFPFSVIKRYLMMWVGEKFYKTSDHFMAEAQAQGISKRIPQLPKDFTVGVDWVLLAHPKCRFDLETGTVFKQGIFTAFCPDRIDYVVKGDEDAMELEKLAEKGLTLVNVIPLHSQAILENEKLYDY